MLASRSRDKPDKCEKQKSKHNEESTEIQTIGPHNSHRLQQPHGVAPKSHKKGRQRHDFKGRDELSQHRQQELCRIPVTHFV
ncbi:uncharacterized protein EURHEDRAFT_410697 [Aspergillus ruber CBS 135680]|uniref:Uncharacterized protein n=1 Tax=Aspergillus ruber (strain CBS 135680) TaxID=1388766 RepID=A0A017SIX6_ASPRC|nr:uncharacterized protein EURHEDRAFT_410697 [Aspergillus ruber CBS 135680]EYE96902.1 hypothetical protein EURHEDRAFT_410697 [Aspergillus ruber CBS 135680]